MLVSHNWSWDNFWLVKEKELFHKPIKSTVEETKEQTPITFDT